MKSFKKISAALVLAAVAGAASATVTFDPVTGLGFVGKGDVQLAFGWTNKQAQDNVRAVTFTFVNVVDYAVTCEWDTTVTTGGRNSTTKVIHHEVTNTAKVGGTNGVPSTARQTGQWTGYNLTGYTSAVSSEPIPVVGSSCHENNGGDNAPEGLITAVDGTGTGPAILYVSTSAPAASFALGLVPLVWPTPVLTVTP